MDPITIAIVAALVAGATAGLTEVSKKVIMDGYEVLKVTLKQKLGPDSDVSKAVENLEARPDSEGRKATLGEEIAAAKADQDAEILAAAQKLVETVAAQSGTERVQRMMRSARGEQTMKGSTLPGEHTQEMGDSPDGKQSME